MIWGLLFTTMTIYKLRNDKKSNSNQKDSNLSLLIDISGSFGDSGIWTIQNDILTISGQDTVGPCNNLESCPYKEYSDSVISIIIENDVTTLSDNVFNDFTLLQSVTLPESVKYIGTSAFSNCQNLQSITIPDAVFLSVQVHFHTVLACNQ